jgi:hypothetical protein
VLYQCPLHVDVARVQLVVQCCVQGKQQNDTNFIKVNKGEGKTVIQKPNTENNKKILKKTQPLNFYLNCFTMGSYQYGKAFGLLRGKK